jgi:hypothetical protein
MSIWRIARRMSPAVFVKLPMSARSDFSAKFKRIPRAVAAAIEQ